MTAAIWPNFFVVGAPKAGTTAMTSALMRHPEVFQSSVKEPNFFNTDIFIEGAPRLRERKSASFQHYAMIRDEKAYLRLYAKAEGFKAIGDYSAHYLRSNVAAAAIHSKIPKSKIVICLRDPSARAFSHYLMDCRAGRVVRPFGECVEQHIATLNVTAHNYENYIDLGLYYKQVKTYYDIFGQEATLVILHDDLIKNFDDTIKGIWRHLDVRQDIDVENVIKNSAALPKFSRLNQFLYKSGIKKTISENFPSWMKTVGIRLYYEHSPDPKMEQCDKDLLKKLFKEDVKKLSSLIKRDLDHWL